MKFYVFLDNICKGKEDMVKLKYITFGNFQDAMIYDKPNEFNRFLWDTLLILNDFLSAKKLILDNKCLKRVYILLNFLIKKIINIKDLTL